MAKVPTSISLEADVKEKAVMMLNDFGLDLSTAVGIFLRQMLRERRFPLEMNLNVPNAVTIAAMEEAEEFTRNPGVYKRYSSFSELLREVEEDA